MENVHGTEQKSATAARIYDYFLGGVHNFPADQEAAKKLIEMFPDIPAAARTNRAFLRRAVRYLANAGVRQFLDIGSGIPTMGNVHEVAGEVAPDSRVVYADIDPVAVAESLEILDGNDRATAIHGDLRNPQAILDHPQLRKLFDLDQPVALLLNAVLHFIADDAEAYGLVKQLVAPLAMDSYLVVSHAAAEIFAANDEKMRTAEEVYRRQAAATGKLRTQSEVAQFFTGRVQLIDPGVVWLPRWRPDPNDVSEFADEPQRSGGWAAVGKIM